MQRSYWSRLGRFDIKSNIILGEIETMKARLYYIAVLYTLDSSHI